MKAMIFAAGLGTRLKPLTNTIPKALVPVGDKPLLQHAIEKLKAAGFNEIIINVHHFAEQIIDFVEANHYFDIHIEFSDEREKLLETGGGIKKASSFLNNNNPFLVHNVDILSNINLQELYYIHTNKRLTTEGGLVHPQIPSAAGIYTPNNPIATLVCSERKTHRYLLFDNNNCLKGWINEKTGEVRSPIPDFNPVHYKKLAFAGIQLLMPSIFKHMNSFPDTFSIIDFYLSICDKEQIQGYSPLDLQIMDVGKIDFLPDASLFLKKIL